MENILISNINSELKESLTVLNDIQKDTDLIKRIEIAANACIHSLKSGGKILLAGNGGSAADAQHIAGELVSRFAFDRPGLSAFALTTDTSILTAIGNDYGYEKLFARQIQANAKKGDIFIAYSTSGNSLNIINAIEEAKKNGLYTIGFTGRNRGKIDPLCDCLLDVPSQATPKIQEGHLIIGHILCGLIEKVMFGRAEDG
jgi:D-sedoheptulose 7-phosphate isomerase